MLVKSFLQFVHVQKLKFSLHRDAEDAIREMDDRSVCGSRIRVEWAKSNGRKPPPRDRGGFGGRRGKSR